MRLIGMDKIDAAGGEQPANDRNGFHAPAMLVHRMHKDSGILRAASQHGIARRDQLRGVPAGEQSLCQEQGLMLSAAVIAPKVAKVRKLYLDRLKQPVA